MTTPYGIVRHATTALTACLVAASCSRADSRSPVASRGPSIADALAIRHVTVIDVSAASAAAAARPDQTVLVVDGHIAEVGPSASVRIPVGAHLVDAHGRYLIRDDLDRLLEEAARKVRATFR